MSRLSNVQTKPAVSLSYPNAGSSSEHLLGLGDAAGLPKTGSASIIKRSHFLSSPLSASCSESCATQCDLSGQTLRETRNERIFADSAAAGLIRRAGLDRALGGTPIALRS